MTQSKTILRKTPRWVKVLFTLSMAINLMMIGAMASRYYFAPKGFDRIKNARLARPGALQRAGFYLVRMAPPERRRQLGQKLRNNSSKLRFSFQKIADTRFNLAKTLKGEPFDRKAFETALEEVHKAESSAHDQATNFTASFLGSLSDKERKIYADLLIEPPRKRWRQHWEGMMGR